MKKSIYIPNTDDPEMQKALSLIFNRLGGTPDIITLTANGDQILGKAFVIGLSCCFFCDPPSDRFYISRGGSQRFTPCPLCEPRNWSTGPIKNDETKTANNTTREVESIAILDQTKADEIRRNRLLTGKPVTRRIM